MVAWQDGDTLAVGEVDAFVEYWSDGGIRLILEPLHGVRCLVGSENEGLLTVILTWLVRIANVEAHVF